MKNNIIYPNIWGKGAIFSYSGLDGENTLDQSLVGCLNGDFIGITFYTPCRAVLRFNLNGIYDIRHEIVVSDMIKTYLTGKEQHFLEVVFATQNTILMRYTNAVSPQIIFEKDVCKKTEDGIQIYNTEGETFAFFEKKGFNTTTAVLTYGENAKSDIRSAVSLDMDTEISKKYKFYENLPQTDYYDINYKKLLNKCFSVMKTQIYTPVRNI